ncbi:iron-sulfur cluster biosynthesis family protein [Gracilibacillus salinarum]|uniref:Iron-sulfur cluster biosynthesis family protein n=1 Tax=Gracilibacillus salinarum TaxID=2932255 RepID=A0ABY4GQG6_9BACI|nr:iron-sulfur cluster biosynthesis family protein [Gracilibacillus salinarum]UOQ85937.1 iron-sulfur cluster biosynthesis family protein [Gracilibacillus salinarum]
MKLTITEQALEKLNTLASTPFILALTYDTEDCGCGVNGMPTVAIKDQPTEYDQPVECDQLEAVVHKQQAVFFSKEMKLDYNGATFRLSSPNEMLNPFIHVRSVTA